MDVAEAEAAADRPEHALQVLNEAREAAAVVDDYQERARAFSRVNEAFFDLGRNLVKAGHREVARQAARAVEETAQAGSAAWKQATLNEGKDHSAEIPSSETTSGPRVHLDLDVGETPTFLSESQLRAAIVEAYLAAADVPSALEVAGAISSRGHFHREAMKAVAAAQASMGDPMAALATVQEIQEPADQARALATVAAALADDDRR